MLTLACTLTPHTPYAHTPPKRGNIVLRTMATTTNAGDPFTELEPPPLSLRSQVSKYFRFPASYVDNVQVVDKKKKNTVCKLCRN